MDFKCKRKRDFSFEVRVNFRAVKSLKASAGRPARLLHSVKMPFVQFFLLSSG